MVVCARSHLRKIRRSFAGHVCCIHPLVLFDAAKRGKRSCTKPTTDPNETEKIALGLEERLHRAIIDIAPANCVARQFWDAPDDASSFMLILVPGIEKERN
jgi:hypothetical protein